MDLASFATGAVLTGATTVSVGTLVHTIRTSTDRIVAALQMLPQVPVAGAAAADLPVNDAAPIDSAVLPAAILTAAFAIHTHRMSTEGPHWGNAPFRHFLDQVRNAPVAETATHP